MATVPGTPHPLSAPTPAARRKGNVSLMRRENEFLKGLADTFMLMKMPFDSQEAKELNIQIFETI